MTDNKNPELWLELSQGEFKLLADGLALHILVKPNGAVSPAIGHKIGTSK